MNKAKNKRLSLHIFHSPIENESRLFKEVNSLIKLNIADEIIIIGTGKSNLQRTQYFASNIKILRSKNINTANYNKITRKFVAIINLLLYFLLVLKFSISHKVSYISVHNLLLLPLGTICKFFNRNSKLIYEPHELETERTGLNGTLKNISKVIEKAFIRYADKVITVCPPITNWYINKYNLNNCYSIRNIPLIPDNLDMVSESTILRDEFQIPEDHTIFIYQGVLDPLRGVDILIDVFKKIENKSLHLVLMGYGTSEDYIRNNVSENIHFKKAVSVDQIIYYTASADVGIFFLDHELSLSYKYCLPNKFYEYLLADLPILISNNLLYLNELVKENELGFALNPNSNDLLTFLNNFSKADLLKFSYNIHKYKKTIGWHFEEAVFLKVYSFE